MFAFLLHNVELSLFESVSKPVEQAHINCITELLRDDPNSIPVAGVLLSILRCVGGCGCLIPSSRL